MQYIYGLYSTKDYLKKNGEFNYFKIKYIGRTKNMDKRLSKHIELKDKPNNSILSSWIKQVYQRHEIKMILLEECEDEKAVEREKYYIELYRHNNLKNIISNKSNSPKSLRYQNTQLTQELIKLKTYINEIQLSNISPKEYQRIKQNIFYKEKYRGIREKNEIIRQYIERIEYEVNIIYNELNNLIPYLTQIYYNGDSLIKMNESKHNIDYCFKKINKKQKTIETQFIEDSDNNIT